MEYIQQLDETDCGAACMKVWKKSILTKVL